MSVLKLTSPSIEANIRIGQPIDEVREIFADIETNDTFSEDAELNQNDLFYRKQEIAFSFYDKTLAAVFLYIKAKGVTAFKGAFGCLDEDFFL